MLFVSRGGGAAFLIPVLGPLGFPTSGVFTVTLNAPAIVDTTVTYQLGGTASLSDYSASPSGGTVSFSPSQTTATVTILPLGSAVDAYVVLTLTGATGAQLSTQSVSTVAIVPTAGLSGDPHLHGPRGERAEFFGVLHGYYVLLSCPQVCNRAIDWPPAVAHPLSLQFEIRVRLGGDGPKARFVKEFRIQFRNASIPLTLWPHKESKLHHYNQLLAPLGGRAE